MPCVYRMYLGSMANSSHFVFLRPLASTPYVGRYPGSWRVASLRAGRRPTRQIFMTYFPIPVLPAMHHCHIEGKRNKEPGSERERKRSDGHCRRRRSSFNHKSVHLSFYIYIYQRFICNRLCVRLGTFENGNWLFLNWICGADDNERSATCFFSYQTLG